VTVALDLVGISRRFGATAALDNAHLRVEQGTVHALLGENGAGKTTLMRIAFGLLVPDRGTISVDGTPVHLSGPADAIRLGLGMVHQHPTQVPAMSGIENLELGKRGRLDRHQSRASAADLLRRVGFAIDLDARVADLAIASQQRLEILKAISRDARILILDEPTAILAPAEARELLGWLRHFASTGGTVVLITHKLGEASEFADAVTVLRGGRTVLEADTGQTTIGELTTAMIGGSLQAAGPQSSRPAGGETLVTAAQISTAHDPGFPSISDATFVIDRGQVIGVVGVEGSGHHELLLALAGRASLSAGTLELPAQVGFVPEDRHRDAVVLPFTITENVALAGAGSRRGGIRWRSMDQRARSLIERFDVRAAGPDVPLSALSGGNQQKVVLGREIDGHPELLVLENPTRGLDIRATAFVHDQIRRCRESGVAVVFYSTDLDEVIDHADRILVVHSGRVHEVPRDRAAAGAAMLGVR
jgi:ABC-type uncharacterized transport system ATPase subunit